MSSTEHNLESLIEAAQQGAIDEERFFSALLDAQVFMPILDRHAIGGFQESSRAEPLVLESKEGGRVVPLFTTPDRARDFLKLYPGYEGGLLAEFRWVIERIGSGAGIWKLRPSRHCSKRPLQRDNRAISAGLKHGWHTSILGVCRPSNRSASPTPSPISAIASSRGCCRPRWRTLTSSASMPTRHV